MYKRQFQYRTYGKGELALLYLPNILQQSAVDRFNEWIEAAPGLDVYKRQLMFKVRNKSLRGLVAAWLCMDAGYFIAAYVNDVMQYPNQLPVYIGFALCFAAPHIDKRISEKKEESEEKERQLSNNCLLYTSTRIQKFQFRTWFPADV